MDIRPGSYAFRHLPASTRLWLRVQTGDVDACWPWTGHRNELGYGAIQVGGRLLKVHRVAYQTTVGPIPAGLVVMHTCDNPPCCNPAHLRLGTVAENNADRHAKGRSVVPVNNLGPQCSRDHEFTPKNTYVYAGKRACRECRRYGQRRRRAAAKAAN
jgi:hypothetical protein